MIFSHSVRSLPSLGETLWLTAVIKSAIATRSLASLEKHPWYGTHWKEQLDKLPEAERDEMLFMLAPRWSDDIQTRDPATARQGDQIYLVFAISSP
jgi:hypothetical protein